MDQNSRDFRRQTPPFWGGPSADDPGEEPASFLPADLSGSSAPQAGQSDDASRLMEERAFWFDQPDVGQYASPGTGGNLFAGAMDWADDIPDERSTRETRRRVPVDRKNWVSEFNKLVEKGVIKESGRVMDSRKKSSQVVKDLRQWYPHGIPLKIRNDEHEIMKALESHPGVWGKLTKAPGVRFVDGYKEFMRLHPGVVPTGKSDSVYAGVDISAQRAALHDGRILHSEEADFFAGNPQWLESFRPLKREHQSAYDEAIAAARQRLGLPESSNSVNLEGPGEVRVQGADRSGWVTEFQQLVESGIIKSDGILADSGRKDSRVLRDLRMWSSRGSLLESVERNEPAIMQALKGHPGVWGKLTKEPGVRYVDGFKEFMRLHPGAVPPAKSDAVYAGVKVSVRRRTIVDGSKLQPEEAEFLATNNKWGEYFRPVKAAFQRAYDEAIAAARQRLGISDAQLAPAAVAGLSFRPNVASGQPSDTTTPQLPGSFASPSGQHQAGREGKRQRHR
ncbi:hypothetical protein ABT336_03395 [Micromonospora sp. NPDC000207]|uniref:hypothetical protein n=1 Tax=Micromonospora sp. NPDC000207 TaxID=3154246 RepID=UPI003327A792